MPEHPVSLFCVFFFLWSKVSLAGLFGVCHFCGLSLLNEIHVDWTQLVQFRMFASYRRLSHERLSNLTRASGSHIFPLRRFTGCVSSTYLCNESSKTSCTTWMLVLLSQDKTRSDVDCSANYCHLLESRRLHWCRLPTLTTGLQAVRPTFKVCCCCCLTHFESGSLNITSVLASNFCGTPEKSG